MRKKSRKQELKEFFFEHTQERFRIRQIAKLLNISPSVVHKYTHELILEKIVHVFKFGNVLFYESNKTSSEFRLAKRQWNERRLFEEGLVEYLKRKLGNPPIIVFGSYQRGENISSSDIDIFIETPVKILIDLNLFEKKIGYPIQLFMHDKINKIKNKNLRNNVVNGTILNGALEVY